MRRGFRVAQGVVVNAVTPLLALGLFVFAAAPVRAETRPPSAVVAGRWCGGEDSTDAQRIAGCSFILDLKNVATKARIAAYFVRGVVYAEQHDYARAIADFTAVLRLDAGHGPSYCYRGDAYSETGDDERAIADFTACIE